MADPLLEKKCVYLSPALCCNSLCILVNRCQIWSRSRFVDSISNGRIQYRTAEFDITTWPAIWPLEVTSLVLSSKVISEFYEIYIYFFLSMKEQVINSLRLVGKCNPAWYSTEVIQIPPGGVSTVHTFNSCTSRPDVCQCLVLKTPMNNLSKNKSTVMAHVA